MYASILVNRSSSAIDRPFDYEIPDYLSKRVKLYSRVIVPFGKSNKLIVGLVTGISNDRPNIQSKLKPIKDVLEEEPFISKYEVEIAEFIRNKTGATYFDSIKLFLPPVNLENIAVAYQKIGNWDDKGLFSNKMMVTSSADNFEPEYISRLLEQGLIRKVYKLKNEPKKNTEEVLIVDCLDYTGLTKLQTKVLNYISEHTATRKDIMSRLGVSISPINSLLKKELIRVEVREKQSKERNIEDRYAKIELNFEQKNVYNGILEDFKRGINNKFLIRGVTGSGKTELYLQLVEEVLRKGKNAIILVPEIGLTPQTVARFRGRFDEEIAIIHSRLNTTERFVEWMKIKNGDARIVVGARSAIFSPLKNIGIVVIDEEHDNSYISSKSPKYNTIDVAKFIVDKNDGMLVLGSATPSIVTYKAAKDGEYALYKLDKRANGKSMPEIDVINMRNELTSGNTSIFSLALYEAILSNLNKGKQTMLFINKRGFSGLVLCRTCGESIKCEHCDVSMTYHKNINRLVCHYCGATKEVPTICPTCGSKKIKEFGIGTEQVEEITKKTFQGARVRRMDRDTTTRKNAHYDLWKDMNDGNIDILIGTQMIAKGLDFKNVTLVGILAADMTLKLPDFRAAEWTFSLIRQVAGRAGRGDIKGRVILQTYEPEHYAIESSVNDSFDEFMEKELKIRKEFMYPPYYKIILVRSRHIDNIKSHENIKKVYDKVVLNAKKLNLKSQILYPNPSPISKVNKVYRWQFMIKALPNEVDNFLSLLEGLDESIINVDIDPINMM